MSGNGLRMSTPTPQAQLGTLCAFLARLRERYLDAGAAPEPGAERLLLALMLAEAALRDLAARVQVPRPAQVAVIGPTQVGKSTVVNLLLGTRAAEVSPLAGYTVHPQAFVGPGVKALDWLEPFFPRWQRSDSIAALSRERLAAYGIVRLPAFAAPLPDAAVLWDTPDFDSLAAHRYVGGVLEVVALADVLLLVVSKEKYADRSVWDTLALLEPLRRPLVVCLNKLTPDGAETITRAVHERLQALAPRHAASALLGIAQRSGPGNDGLDLPGAPALRAAIAGALAEVRPETRYAGCMALLQTHWEAWTAPVRAELQALAEWQQLVRGALEAGLAAYRRDYLDHPQRFDTFRRALVELLYLLELPGLAGALTRVRHLLTWPARKLFEQRQTWVARHRGDTDSEALVLEDTFEHLLTALGRDATRRAAAGTPATAFWRALGERLASAEPELAESFAAAARRHHDAFKPEVQAAADRLYARLRERPALLNTLRAARATTDAAAIALAVKTGGLGVQDLVFAPAMLSLTSMLTESALGTYMSQVAGELRERQYHAVAHGLFAAEIGPRLQALGMDLQGPALFAISAEELQRAEQALQEALHG